MTDPHLRDAMFHRIMRGLVDTGRAPHYAELARPLGLSVENARLLLHEVMQAYPDRLARTPRPTTSPRSRRSTTCRRNTGSRSVVVRSGSRSVASRRRRHLAVPQPRPSASTRPAWTAATR